MQKNEFIRQLNELIPKPNPVTTEVLYRFDRECAETEPIDMLTALRVVARNFREEALQGAYEIIQHQNAALPSEMFAASVYLQAGRTPAEVSQMAVKGALMGFFGPERPEDPSRIAVCTVMEAGREHRFYSMHFGDFHPQQALEKALEYGREKGMPAVQALTHLSIDGLSFTSQTDGPRGVLVGWESELTKTLFQIQHTCPAVAAHITYHVDQGMTDVAYNPLWLEQNQGQSQAPIQRMWKNCWILRARCGMLCA